MQLVEELVAALTEFAAIAESLEASVVERKPVASDVE